MLKEIKLIFSLCQTFLKYLLNSKKIGGIDEFWTWTIKKLSKGLRANNWYNNGQPYGLAGYINDFASRMVGYAALRQLRVRNSKINFINI